MALTAEQQEIWDSLRNSKNRHSFKDEIRHKPEDTAFESPGVYTIWEGKKPIYIGIATLSRPDGAAQRRLWGLKDRLESHRRGRISGSSLAIAVWFCRIAPKLSKKEHLEIGRGKKSPSAYTENFIRELHYSHHKVPKKDLHSVESALCRKIKPELNEWQDFISRDTQVRSKQMRLKENTRSS
jgi:hypothetical protein